MRRNLSYYWRINVAVVLGAAVATAVLTGALLVGDSVKGSLRDLTLERLGNIDFLLIRQSMFRESLAGDLLDAGESQPELAAAAPAIILNGNAINASSRTRASQVNVLGVDDRFLDFYANAKDSLAPSLEKKSGQLRASVVINQSLQQELGAEVGDQILLTFEKPSEIARASLLGDKDTEDIVETLRLQITRVIPDRGIGRFGLRPHQTLPLNAFISLPVLQDALEQSGKVNAVVLQQKQTTDDLKVAMDLQSRLQKSLQFEDLGLKFVANDSTLVLESSESILGPKVTQAAEQVLQEIGAPVTTVYTYLANRMQIGDNLTPYSTVAAISLAPQDSTKLQTTSGEPVAALQGKEILLNEWTANDLVAEVGDSLTMTYFGVGSRDELATRETKFVVKGIVKMSGLGADPTLTPDFPGIADANNMADWNPPFEIDLGLIRDKDEAYWDEYRGTPKAFVALATGQELWGSRFGNVTSLRFSAAPGLTLEEARDRFQSALLETATPKKFDYAFQPVKAQGLASASGATDFGGLFIGFSLFLIVSAALLVGMLFRLGVEQRGREAGMLLAVGYPVRRVLRQFLQEGTVLAVIGALLGLLGAVFYAWLMIAGLGTWWVAAIGSSFLNLHVSAESLVLGYVISLVVILLSIWLGFRKLRQVPPPALLAGVTTSEKTKTSARKAKLVANVSIVLAVVLVGLAFTMSESTAASLFFGIGALVLIAGLGYFSLWLRTSHKPLTASGGAAVLQMAARNSPRNPGRSMLSAALVGCACFVIVAVGANRTEFDEDQVMQKDSGAGGFSLVAQADIPLNRDLSTPDGRFALGFSDDDSELLSKIDIVPFRFLPGEDASCLNLYQVEKPRILGVPRAQIERGGFQFQQVAETETDDHSSDWQLLNQDLGENVIPAFGDYNSVLWILHSGLGKDLTMTDQFGQEIKLRFVGLFQKSIFQSEILISEEAFLQHFPDHSGYAYFLIDAPVDQKEEVTRILEETLTDYGFDVTGTAEKLSNFQAVENTYLSTFQTLGGLGLLLGTLGLGMILIRNVIERRGELATLRAFGFRRRKLAEMVVAENGFLLSVGILLGTFSAVLAVAPHILQATAPIPWLSLAGTLVVVFLVGMLASLAAVSVALRIPLLPALRAE